jgi:Tol biopolymer transport system component
VNYRLIAKIGEGGMGEVWRATDVTLGREVAIKILPAAFASDPERLARFEREAKLLASLNHPNIATVHGFHEEDGKRFLAMELVPGEDLAERLKAGALPIAEALDVARQTAEALEAAHEHGIVHRDLKPANVKLTPDGRVKVLDFGLAKAGDVAAARDSGLSPTITSLGTVAGVIIGTAAYMSPEQARGKPVDKRADVWAFGCLLFEMLSGKRPFDGETVSDTLAAVLAKDPDWSLVPTATPARVRDLLLRCLEKDARRRLRDIGEARIELENALVGRTSSGPLRAATEPVIAAASAPARSPVLLWIAVAAALLATGVAAWSWMRPAGAPVASRLMRLRVERPAGESFIGPGRFALAPDGTAVVFVVNRGLDTSRLWLRELSGGSGVELPNTENAAFPFWSPDGRSIAFFADAKLKRIPRSGGAVQTICDAPTGRGGMWTPSGVIVFAPSPFSALMKVSADGGIPEPATTLDTAKKQDSHRFPELLADGKTFVYGVMPTIQPILMQIEIASLDDPVGRPLLLARNVPRYASPGYLIFPRDQALVAQRIDLTERKMIGDIVPLADRADVVDQVIGAPATSAAADGSIVYDEPDRRATDGMWFGRDGRPIDRAFRHAGRVLSAAMNLGANKLLVMSNHETGYVGTVIDLAGGTETRIVREDRLPRFGTWYPRSDRILVILFEQGQTAIVSMAASGGDERRVFTITNRWLVPSSIAPDETIVFDDPFHGKFTDIVLLPPGAGGEPIPYLATGSDEQGGFVSPDGRFIAYTSDASGRFEVYVDTFPKRGEARRVSIDGAAAVSARWRGDGRELFFVSADGRTLMASELSTSPALTAGKARALFTLPPEVFAWAPAPDGQRFLIMVPVGEPRTALTLVQNWSAQLERGQLPK